jgi:hypothetical protein
MGWYSNYIVHINLKSDYFDNNVIMEKFTEQMRDEEIVGEICEEEKLPYDIWCGCGNTEVNMIAHSWILTTTLKYGQYDYLETIVELIKHFLPKEIYTSIVGEVDGGYEYNGEFTRLEYNSENGMTENS